MKSFFKEIFEYHHKTNQKLIRQLTENMANLSERTIPLFSHTINAHQIWNSRIRKTPSLGVFDVHTLETCMHLDTKNYEQTIDIISNRELSSVITYKDSKGNVYSNTIFDILYHIGNHCTHHRGQVISDLRQNGIPPILTDYIFYKREIN